MNNQPISDYYDECLDDLDQRSQLSLRALLEDWRPLFIAAVELAVARREVYSLEMFFQLLERRAKDALAQCHHQDIIDEVCRRNPM